MILDDIILCQMYRLMLAIAAWSLCTGCARVNLALKNTTPAPLTPTVLVSSVREPNARTLELSSIPPGGILHETFSVQRNQRITVVATLPSSAEVFRESHEIGRSGRAIEIDLMFKGGQLLKADADVDQAIVALLSRLSQDSTANPVGLQDALDRAFGGIAVLKLSAANQSGVEPLYRISPAGFDHAVAKEDVEVQRNHDAGTVILNSTQLSDLINRSRLFRSADFTPELKALYRFNWDMNGYGFVYKTERPSFAISTAIKSLTQAQHADICKQLVQNPTAEAVYVNQIYLVKNLKIMFSEAQKIPRGVPLDSESVISDGIAYTFSNSKSFAHAYSNLVFGAAGTLLGQSEFDCATRSAAQTPPRLSGQSLSRILIDGRGLSALMSLGGIELTPIAQER
jgi:hypothetical protein